MKNEQIKKQGKKTKAAQGEFQKLCETKQDIPKHKKVEVKLKKAAEEWLTTFNSIVDMVSIHDKDFKLVKVNKAFADTFKVKPEELIGKKCYEIVHGTKEPPTFCPHKQTIDTTKPHRAEFFEPHLGVYLEMSTSPIFDEHGEFTATVHISKDITERKRVEEALRKSKEQHRFIFEGAADGIIYIDRKGNAIEINPAFTDITGFPREEVVGKNAISLAKKFAKPKDIPRLLRAISQMLRGIPVELFELEINNKIIEINTPVLNKETAGITGIIRDITERKKAEKRQTLRFEISKTFHQQKSRKNICKKIVSLIKEYLDCEVAALRMKEGDDYPYFVNNSFSQKFINSENYLCVHDKKGNCLRDSRGHPVLACMCGIVINAKFNQGKPFFTKEGSFWTNSTSDLLASTTAEDRGATTRNVCNQYGYESVALIPIKVKGDNIGLLQINDKRRNFFSLGSIQFLEELGRIIGIAIESKKAEEALHESEQKYRKLFEGTTDAIFVADAETGTLIDCNSAAVELVGRKKSELVGKHQRILHPPEEIEGEFSRTFKQQIKEKEGKVLEAQVITKKGQIKDVEIRAGCLELQGEKCVQGIFRDITERKKAEEKARRHQLELAHISRLSTIGQMASELAHELNQPLCATLSHLEGCLGMVKSGSSDADKILKKLETAIKQIDKAGAIVSRVKGFAIKGKIQRSTAFINDIVLEALRFSETELQLNHISTELNLGEKIQPVLANSIQIEQVILNLIQNATEAMKNIPKKHRKLIISTTTLDNAIEVAVKDRGKGIDKDKAEKIFESFVTTKSKGLGIGLSISQSIIESHGGRIYFKDNSEHGVTFCFTLPLITEKV